MRWLSLIGAACLLAAVAAACGGTSSSHGSTGTSAGSGGTTGADAGGCTDDTECNGSYCINAKCGSCRGVRPLLCPAQTHCAQSGACLPDLTTTGSSGSTGTTGAVTSCDHRSDCPNAQACLGLPDAGLCGAPGADAGCARNDDCVKAFICQAGSCVFGCSNDTDCHGTAQPVCYPGNPGHCGACTQSTQCHADENCAQGQCVPKSACTTADTCAGLGCVSGFCGPCTAASDCSNGNQCDTNTGHCVAGPAGCTSDAQCQSQHSGGLGWWCDASGGGVPECRAGCVPDFACSTPQVGCCNLGAGKSCDTASHNCVDAPTTGSTSGTTTAGTTSTTGGTTGSCAANFCDSCFNAGQQCDQTNCVCVGGSTTATTGGTGGGTTGGSGGCVTGAAGQPCGSSCQCNSGLTCSDGSATYSPGNLSDIFSCQLYYQYCDLFPILTCQ